MKTSYSLSSARKEARQAPTKVDWQLSEGARRNSVLTFAEEYSSRRDSPSTAFKPEFAKRPSIAAATDDKPALMEITNALCGLLESFDHIDDMGVVRNEGIKGLYKMTADGDMFILNKIEAINVSAFDALQMLWDHRTKTVASIWKGCVEQCDIKAELSPVQRLLHLRYAQPTMGIVQNTSARDTAVVATKLTHGSVPMITFSSVTTNLIPEEEHYVRGEAKVLGIAVLALSPKSCSVFLACEFAMRGAFDHPWCNCLLKWSGIDKAAARNCALDANKCLKRLKIALESVYGEKETDAKAPSVEKVAEDEEDQEAVPEGEGH